MRAYSLYICDRSKVCLFHRDWTESSADEATKHNNFITLYGLFFQMKLFATAADPTKPIGTKPGCKPDGMRPMPIGEGTSFRHVPLIASRPHWQSTAAGLQPRASACRSPGCDTSMRTHVPHVPRGMRADRHARHRRQICTDTYQLNFLEVPSGVKVVLNTSPAAGSLRYLLERVYQELYVAFAVKDPTQLPGQRITSPLFEEEVDAFFRKTGLL